MSRDSSYNCPADDFPFEYSDWDPYWYSPLCRGWYKLQQSKPRQNTMGDLYIFASGEVFGLTPCAPIVKYDIETGSELDFKTALCMDLDISGKLDMYYIFQNQTIDIASYMLFNEIEDENYRDSTVNDDSHFIKFMKQVTEQNIQ